MDALIRCRLCGSLGTEDGLLLPTSEELTTKIKQLFSLHIGGNSDRLSCCVCDGCSQTVNSTWRFFERIQTVQVELNKALTENTVSTCSQTVFNATNMHLDVTQATDESLEDKERAVLKLKIDGAKLIVNEEECNIDDNCEANSDDNIVVRRNNQGWDAYPWACFDCGASMLNYYELQEHYMQHPNYIRFVCADCPKVYTKHTMFLSHVRVHRPYLKFCCDVCNKWFRKASQQEKHRADHSENRPHTCHTCGKCFRMQSALVTHAKSHLPAELKNLHQCDQCPKKFATKPNLMAHQRIHSGVRDFTCDQCGKSFVQKGNLDNHLLTHTSLRPFSCTFAACAKTFKTLMRLKKHASVHSGLKPYQCDVCGRQFRERGTLKEHHRIHTGAMPFKCEFCGKSFRFKSVLTTHRRTHTGERPYSCLECQHHFTNWPNYNKHMKRRHGINTSVTVRKPQQIPPTGMPQRNPPGAVLAQPQLPEGGSAVSYVEMNDVAEVAEVASECQQFYINSNVLGLYNLQESTGVGEGQIGLC